MKVDVAAEVAACLKSAPGGDCSADQVRAWLFDSRYGVAVRMSRIVQDKPASDLLTEAAGRSWRQCADSDSEPQRLWRDLGTSFGRIASEDDRASVRVGPFPKDWPHAVNLLPAVLVDGSRTVRVLAGECRNFCAAPLLTPSDLVCPFPQVSLPYFGPVRQWQNNPQAVRFFCNVEQVAVGDFIPASAVLRVRLLTVLRFVLRSEWTLRAGIDSEYGGFVDRVKAIHGQLWATPDADARSGAMALLQVYLAGEKACGIGPTGYEADWSILPAAVPKWLDEDLDRPMDSDRRIEALGLPATFVGRRGRLGYALGEAVKARPDEVVSTVKAGLEWLASGLRQATAPGPVGGDIAQGPRAIADWRDVQARLLCLYEGGQGYTSQRDLAKRLGCSESTVNRAIHAADWLTVKANGDEEGAKSNREAIAASRRLKGWMARAREAKGSPKAQSLNEVVTDNTPSLREPDPADGLGEDEVDRIMGWMIEQAKPEERAILNGLNADGRREMARMHLQQQAEMHIEDKAPGGNRIRGRKP